MSPRWTLRKYRQISFFLEAGENFDIDPQKYSSDESYAKGIDQRLRDGVVYPDKKKKYWVDLKEQDCFAIYARALIITNSDDPNYWRWTTDSDGVETAMVKKAKWLEIRGSFWTTNLSAGVKYEVSFRTRMEEKEKLEWPDMNTKEVNLRLITPSGKNQEGQATLPGSKSEDDPWYELKLPHERSEPEEPEESERSERSERFRFTMTAENVGKMEFVMEASFKSWRAGLVIKGVEIKPVDDKKLNLQQEQL